MKIDPSSSFKLCTHCINKASRVPASVWIQGWLSQEAASVSQEFIKLLLLWLCHDSVEGIDLNGGKRYVNNGRQLLSLFQTPQANVMWKCQNCISNAGAVIKQPERQAVLVAHWGIRKEAVRQVLDLVLKRSDRGFPWGSEWLRIHLPNAGDVVQSLVES